MARAFTDGAYARIIANETKPDHFLPVGTRVRITGQRAGSSRRSRTWYIKAELGELRYALETDLELEPTNEDLDAMARELFGVDPPSHCPTCGRKY